MAWTPTVPWGRFDDLRDGRAQLFPRVDRALVAEHPDDVPAVLDEVERLTARGRWAFGFVAYEAARALDPGLGVGLPLSGLPLAWFGVSALPWAVRAVTPGAGGYRAGPWSVDWTPQRHRDRVLAVRRSIAAGDTYQCNLTTRLTGPVGGDLARFYADLAHRQRGRYNAFLDLGRFVVASASPELFFELRGRRVLTRPMKGTAARGATPDEDDKRRHRLRHSAKDRAENTMIVDLIRNDLARVARTGTVEVTALCQPERYETVHQLTSEVAAELRPDVGLLDVFRALFPSGSVTGAPKASTMRLITELEQTPRGIYCGAIGVVGPPGTPVRARFSVAIRTALVDRGTDTAVYGSGGGITWDSDPDDEYAELLTKARILDPAPPARQMS